MKKITIPTILFWISLTVYGQQYSIASQPGYNTTVPRLMIMGHRAVSFIGKVEKLAIQDFEQKTSKENINIYVVYEKDSTIGKGSGDEQLFNPPAKLMDLYLIYDYTYKIYCPANEINGRIPKITLAPGSVLNELKVAIYFIDPNGKLKDKKIKKSNVISNVANGFLSIQLDQDQLIQNSFIEIHAQIKTRNFATLAPSISSGANFNTLLTISYPTILNYKIPDNPSLALSSSSTSQFELLNFARDPGAGNGKIKIFKIDEKIFSWKIKSNNENNYKTEFELEGLNIPPGSDIGFSPMDITMIN